MKKRTVDRFRDIPNVGPAFVGAFTKLGLQRPADLVGKDPYQMFEDYCRVTKEHQDPCVLDVFISVVRYMEGGPKQYWWDFTAERKAHLKRIGSGT